MSRVGGETLVLLLLGAAHSLNHSLFLVVPPLLERIALDLGASYQALGLITTITFFIYGAGALIGGPLSDRIGPVRVSRISMGVAGAASFTLLVSRDLVSFSLGMFSMALPASFYHPTSNSLIAGLFPRKTAGAMGLHGAAGSVGQIFTPVVAFWIGVLLDWRIAFAFFGALSVATAAVMGRVPETIFRAKMKRGSIFDFFKIPSMRLILLYNVLIGLYFRGVELFFPTLLSVGRGLSGQLAAVSNSLLLFFGVIGQYIGGKAADRFGSSMVVLVYSLGVVASMLFLLILPWAFVGVVLFIILFGLSYFGHQPAMTALVSSVTSPDYKGLAYGVMFFCTFGLGSASAAIAGYFADAYSLDAAYWAMALFSFMGLLVSMILMRKTEK